MGWLAPSRHNKKVVAPFFRMYFQFTLWEQSWGRGFASLRRIRLGHGGSPTARGGDLPKTTVSPVQTSAFEPGPGSLPGGGPVTSSGAVKFVALYRDQPETAGQPRAEING